MAQVSLILSEDVPNLGEAGDVVHVKPGYARNYLLPRGMASIATDSRVKELEHHKRVIADKMARQMKDLEALRDRIQSITLEATAQAGEGGRLFGSVTSQQIAALLAEKGFEIDRRKIDLGEPIKTVGEHVVTIKLRREFLARAKVVVSAAKVEAAEREAVEVSEPESPSGSGDEESEASRED